MADDVETQSSEETPPLIAYRSLVYDEAQRLYELAVLLVEDPSLAMQLVLRSLDRTWTSLTRRQLYMDIDEAAFWGIVREAAQQRGRSTEVRGYQPPTTSNDRHITAVGVASGFSPEQSAAVYQVGRLGSSYQFAGVISGIGEPRARDIVYAARQEYREARTPFVPAGPECSRLAPLLSARVDGEVAGDVPELEAHLATCPVCQTTLQLYEDFNAALRELRLPPPAVDVVEESLAIPTSRPDQAPRGWRRMLRLLAGPWGLIPFFIVGAVILRQCSPPPVEIGVGRTSDLVFARAAEAKGILVLESGSGRELNHLPPGVLAPTGYGVYTDAVTCGDSGCFTFLTMTDTATGDSTPIARLDGNLHLVAVATDRTGYLVDEDAGWNRLVAVGLGTGRVQGSLDGPAELRRAFAPERSVHLSAQGVLYTLGRRAGDESLAIVRTDLQSLRVERWFPLEGATTLGVSMTPSADGRHLFVYLPAEPSLLDVDPLQGRIARRVALKKADGSAAASFVPTEGTLAAADPRGEILYCVLPSGGVAAIRLDSLELVRELGADRRYRSIGVSSDGGSLYTLGFDGTYRVLDASSGAQRVNRGQVRADDILQVNSGE